MTNFKLAGVHIWQDGADVDGGKTWYGSARADVNIFVTSNHSVIRK